jgi:hypothetical protein
MYSWIEKASAVAGCSGCYSVRSRQHDRNHRQPEECENNWLFEANYSLAIQQ